MKQKDQLQVKFKPDKKTDVVHYLDIHLPLELTQIRKLIQVLKKLSRELS